MNGFLDRARLLELFDELSDELRFTRTHARIYIVGGAAMSLAYSQERRTDDVDARIDAGHYRLTEAVRKVGRRHGLTDSWLNDQVTTAIPRKADVRAKTLYQSQYLTVTGASAKHLLAMKLAAAREKDVDDIGVLCKQLELKDAEAAIGIFGELFPKEQVKPRAHQVLAEVFRDRSVDDEQ